MSILILAKCLAIFTLYFAPCWVPTVALALWWDRRRWKRRTDAARNDFRHAYKAWKSADAFTDAAHLYELAEKSLWNLKYLKP